MKPGAETEATKAFPCSREGMVDALTFLERFYDDPRPSIIMDEIVSNIVRCSKAQSFSMAFRREGDDEVMEFADDGVPFDPTREIASPDLTSPAADRQVGGLGIFMVRKMSKSLAYARVDGRNVLTVRL